MKTGFGPSNCAIKYRRISDISANQFYFIAQVRRAFGLFAVDLRRKAVKGSNVVAVNYEFIGQMGANKAGSSRN